MSDPDFDYTPFQATPKAIAVYVAATAVLGAMEVAMGGTLVPIVPIQSNWHLLFWAFVVLSPVTLLQLGWSYALEGREFVVRRFGTERHRLPLATYLSRSSSFGGMKLVFGGRSLRLVGTADEARATFFEELDRRLLDAGTVTAQELLPTTTGTDVSIRIGKARFPERCVCCGDATAKTTSVEGRRGIDLIFWSMFQVATIPVPVCERHGRDHTIARWGVPTGVFVGSTLVGTAVISVLAPKTGETAWLLGIVVGALAVRIASAFNLRRHIDAHVLGVSAIGLDASLENVTLRIRDADLRHALVSQASGDVVARVFA